MAKIVITDALLTLGGTDYSAQVSSVSIDISRDEVDVTNMDSDGWREFLGGLKSYQVNIEWVKDSDLSGLDSAIWTEISSGDANMAWTARRSDDTVATTNPTYSGNLIVTGWTPISGAVGDRFQGSSTFRGTGAITRATA